jgi:diguanylate cyclase (GGDEF)-like protein
VARVGLAATAILGFPLMLQAQSKQTEDVEGGLLFWSVLLAWTFLAGVLALVTFQDPRLSILLQAALCCVLIALAFILVRFSFGEGYLAKAHLTDQVRRSLALAGAKHHLWDWAPDDGDIDYGEDFARVLGHRIDILEEGGQELFIELLHPEDRPDFVSSADAVASGAARHIEQDVRLKAADGSYRWFALRARTLAGKGTAQLRCIGTLTDISKSKELEQRLLKDSVHDPVTGLPSRAIFMDRLSRSATSNTALPVHVLLIDLDRFKTLNDGLGHDIGDELLRVTGLRIAEAASADCTVARMSGSQFAVLFPVAGKGANPIALAEAIRDAVAESIDVGARAQNLSASVGISLRSAYGVDADELLGQAAAALHAAREKGLGSTVIYDATLRDDRAADVALESDLRRAIGRAEIEVHYQPIMQLTTLDIVGFEALARWRHPQLGLVAPENFIDAAERAGLIGEIGKFMLTEASRQLGQWQRTLFRNRDIFVAVNISASQLLEPDFLSVIQHILSRELLAPGSLKIEVTESVVMRYPERVERLFNHLRAMGIGLACDDFGTGFSSLSSLKQLPFDTLKLDRSFCSGDGMDERGSHIVSSIAVLAHGLGMAVVAEGIEMQSQIDTLAALGCDYGQGFLLGSPVTAKSVEDAIGAPNVTPVTPVQRGPFASTVLSPEPFHVAPPPPGEAPMAPRAAKEDAEVSTVEPDLLPSIFDVGSKAKKRPVKRRRKKKVEGVHPTSRA